MDWDKRYSEAKGYLFGEEPNAFLRRNVRYIRPGMKVLAVADGDGRNGVWMARQGTDVTSTDASQAALQKAENLAEKHAVSLNFIHADLLEDDWPENEFDLVVAIFVQFAGPEHRPKLFQSMKNALKPGGILLLEGYTPAQIKLGTGGPRAEANMYTEELLKSAFSDFELIHLHEYEAELSEGSAHAGLSALIDLIAQKPA